ncbi:hypothetical protein D3C72_2362130 [compost metagenome]
MDISKIKTSFGSLIDWIKDGFTKKADLVDGKVPVDQGGSPIIVTFSLPDQTQVDAAPEGTVWIIPE